MPAREERLFPRRDPPIQDPPNTGDSGISKNPFIESPDGCFGIEISADFRENAASPMENTPEKSTPENRPPESPAEALLARFEIITAEMSSEEDFDPNEPSMRNSEKSQLENAGLDAIANTIRECAVIAEKATRATIHRLSSATLNAWTCGSALNIAKARLEHGQFLVWFDKEFTHCEDGDQPFSLRTAQRYMKVAGKYPTTEEMIGSIPSLRKAYQACGVLPAPPESEEPAVNDRDTAARASLLKSVTAIQARLSRFSDRKISLDEGTRKELLDAKTEIDRLFASLVG